nr:immunoglobulin heavy chain junction region [Macaca mulatta]
FGDGYYTGPFDSW